MTIQEASIHLPFDNENNIEDVFELKLFEFKQFFLQKSIIDKVYKSKLEKLKLLQEAFYTLTNKKSSYQTISEKLKLEDTNNILLIFNCYQKNKNYIRLKISQSVSSLELINSVENLLELQHEYLQKWPDIEYSNDVVISKEKDPMELYYAIQEFASKGGILFDDINLNINNCPEILRNECKRLSLCRNLK